MRPHTAHAISIAIPIVIAPELAAYWVMQPKSLILPGKYIRLVPLDESHIESLVAAAAVDPTLYKWSYVPQGISQMKRYIETASSWRDAGTAVPFAIIREPDGILLGSTRFYDLERWAWPHDHPRHGRPHPDVCEIGYTWYTSPAIRTWANTEGKLLMLTHAFETWQVFRVSLHTDARNQRSRAAIERIGGKYDGTLRAHRIATDNTPRDSIRYSIVASEWPDLKKRLSQLLPRS